MTVSTRPTPAGLSRTYRYRVYGLHLTTNLDLPLPPCDRDAPDDPDAQIAVHDAPPPFAADSPPGFERFDRERILGAFPNVAIVRVADGRRIDIWPAPGADFAMLRYFAIGNALAMLLFQRGRLVLHASCAVVAGRAVAFVGQSGAGKTSFAAGCDLHGHPVLSDDLAVVDPAGDLNVPAGYRFMKLSIDVARALGCDATAMEFLHEGEPNKRACPLRHRPGPGPWPLAAIYLIETGDTESIERVRGHDALVAMLPHCYPTRVMMPGDHEQLRQIVALLGRVPLFRFTRRKTFDRLPHHIAMVERHVASLDE